MSAVEVFHYESHDVRTVAIDGEPWFVLADLCKVMGISEVSIVRRRLDDALCQTHPTLDSLGRTQQATIVSEPGMYEVVLRSDKPEAAAFRRWITSEVLPSIRRTGGYGVQELTAAVERMTTMQWVDLATGLTRRAELAEVKTSSWARPDGEQQVSRSTRVTPKGLDWLSKRYAQPGKLVAIGNPA